MSSASELRTIHGTVTTSAAATIATLRTTISRDGIRPHHTTGPRASSSRPSPRVKAATPTASPIATADQRLFGSATNSANSPTSTNPYSDSARMPSARKICPGITASSPAARRAAERPKERSATR